MPAKVSSNTSVPPKTSDQLSNPNKPESTWYGRTWTFIQDSASNVFGYLNRVKSSTYALCTLARGTTYAIAAASALAGRSVLSKLGSSAETTTALIDAIQPFPATSFLWNLATGKLSAEDKLKWDNTSVWGKVGKLFLMASDFGGSILWVCEIGYVAFETALDLAQKIGSNRYFAFIVKLPLAKVVVTFVGLGFLGMGIDAGIRIVTQSDMAYSRGKACVELTACAFEVIGKGLVIFGCTAAVPLGILGATAAALWLTNVGIEFFCAKQLESERKAHARAMTDTAANAMAR